MKEIESKNNRDDVEQFIHNVVHPQRRMDSWKLLEIMNEATKLEPKMWGSAIIGYGLYHYKYKSGREGDWFMTGFSPRKQNLSIYIMAGFTRYDLLMTHLGKHKTGKACLYVNTLKDIDLNILKLLIKESMQYMNKRYNLK